MTLYAVNSNGDWWEFEKGDSLTILDTSRPEIKALLKETETDEGEDGFEDFIAKHGDAVAII